MGYTHYFPQQKKFTDVQWNTIVTLASTVLSEAEHKGVAMAGPLGRGKPKLNTAQISFNGAEPDDFETFRITKQRNADFNFCKTGRRPYDVVVTALLALIHQVAPGVLEIGSDGDEEEWAEGLALAAKVNGGQPVPYPVVREPEPL